MAKEKNIPFAEAKKLLLEEETTQEDLLKIYRNDQVKLVIARQTKGELSDNNTKLYVEGIKSFVKTEPAITNLDDDGEFTIA